MPIIKEGDLNFQASDEEINAEISTAFGIKLNMLNSKTEELRLVKQWYDECKESLPKPVRVFLLHAIRQIPGPTIRTNST